MGDSWRNADFERAQGGVKASNGSKQAVRFDYRGTDRTMKKTPMKRTDIRKDSEGNWKTPTPLKPVGKRGRRINKTNAASKKRIVRERGLICEDAGLSPCSGRIEMHHIRTQAAHPELRATNTNLRLVCKKHHDLAHGIEWKS